MMVENQKEPKLDAQGDLALGSAINYFHDLGKVMYSSLWQIHCRLDE